MSVWDTYILNTSKAGEPILHIYRWRGHAWSRDYWLDVSGGFWLTTSCSPRSPPSLLPAKSWSGRWVVARSKHGWWNLRCENQRRMTLWIRLDEPRSHETMSSEFKALASRAIFEASQYQSDFDSMKGDNGLAAISSCGQCDRQISVITVSIACSAENTD